MEETKGQVQEIEGKKYSRADEKDFVAGEHYLLPNGKLYYCFIDGPKAVFLPTFDNEAPMNVFGNSRKVVIDLKSVS